jgi:hypothetical protein
MSTVATVLVIALGVLLLLAVGGALATTRIRHATHGRFDASLREVNRRLAAARAQDRGWERGAMEAAARHAFAQLRPGEEPRELTLVQVVDRPGTDEDKAVFRVLTDVGTSHLTMGRESGAWVGERVEPA